MKDHSHSQCKVKGCNESIASSTTKLCLVGFASLLSLCSELSPLFFNTFAPSAISKTVPTYELGPRPRSVKREVFIATIV